MHVSVVVGLQTIKVNHESFLFLHFGSCRQHHSKVYKVCEAYATFTLELHAWWRMKADFVTVFCTFIVQFLLAFLQFFFGHSHTC